MGLEANSDHSKVKKGSISFREWPITHVDKRLGIFGYLWSSCSPRNSSLLNSIESGFFFIECQRIATTLIDQFEARCSGKDWMWQMVSKWVSERNEMKWKKKCVSHNKYTLTSADGSAHVCLSNLSIVITVLVPIVRCVYYYYYYYIIAVVVVVIA